MKQKRVIVLVVLLLEGFSFCSAVSAVPRTLATLYEEIFHGARVVHIPQRLYYVECIVEKILKLDLNGKYPFSYGTVQGVYEYPSLTNDDDDFLYFSPPINQGSDIEIREKTSFSIRKNDRVILPSGPVEDIRQYLANTIYGFYKNKTSTGDGKIKLEIRNSMAVVRLIPEKSSEVKGFQVINPKDLDSGKDLIIMARSVPIETELPTRTTVSDMELIVYSQAKETIIKDFSFPFVDHYWFLGFWGTILQSVAGQRLVYLGLGDSILSDPEITIPQGPHRWHLLVYDLIDDSLYSVWHTIDEEDGLQPLSFSYYLGKEGLYFQVLKDAKLEVYLLKIDLGKAKTLEAYETVDLLWNNRGLKELWEKRVIEAKANDRSFKAVWQ